MRLCGDSLRSGTCAPTYFSDARGWRHENSETRVGTSAGRLSLARDDRRDYGHLAADAERVELDHLDAYDATYGRGLATAMSED